MFWRGNCRTLDSLFCLSALKTALRQGRPEIFNTDQGVQFTSAQFTGHLESQCIAISMEGKGRCFDNIFIERLWRTVKYEEVYLKDYRDPAQAIGNLGDYFAFYNGDRFHESLAYRTPSEVHFGEGGIVGNNLGCRTMPLVIG